MSWKEGPLVDWETKLSMDLRDFFCGAARHVHIDPLDVAIELEKWGNWADEWHSACSRAAETRVGDALSGEGRVESLGGSVEDRAP